MKKSTIGIIVKVGCFLLIFCVLFLAIQSVFRFKGWGALAIDTRLRDYEQAAERGEEIDVVCLGTSALFRGMVPVVMYEQEGITSFNFGSSLQNAMCEYYLLKSIVEIHAPEVVILDLSSLYEDRMADNESRFLRTYYQTADGLQDYRIRQELIEAILQDNPSQNRADLMFPLLREHSKWTSLDKDDYLSDPSVLPKYARGCLLGDETTVFSSPSYVTEAQISQQTQTREISEYSLNWYEKIFTLCEEYGIEVMVVAFPTAISGDSPNSYYTLETFCKERDIDYFNYATAEQISAAQIDATDNFHDAAHLNVRGGIRVSRLLAENLAETYGLKDRRGNENYSQWDEDWAIFYSNYTDITAAVGM